MSGPVLKTLSVRHVEIQVVGLPVRQGVNLNVKLTSYESFDVLNLITLQMSIYTVDQHERSKELYRF